MKDIKAVIWDIGGVVIQTADHSARTRWESHLGLPAGGAEYIVLNSEMGRRAQLGSISNEELWSWVGDHLELGDELTSFRSDFWAGDQVDLSLVALIEELRPNYATAVISNASDALNSRLEDKYRIAGLFDLIVGSAYEGIMKPDAGIYLRTLERLELRPEQAVFIDDSADNVAAAQELGMQAIHFSPHIDLRSKLEAVGVDVAASE